MKTLNKLALFLIILVSVIIYMPVSLFEIYVSKENRNTLVVIILIFSIAIVVVFGAYCYCYFDITSKVLHLYDELCINLTWS